MFYAGMKKGDKLKLKKYYLTMYLREAYAIFMEENLDEVSFSLFCNSRPQNVLLLKDTPYYQCLCQTHENFRLALHAVSINYEETFWNVVLCDTTPNSNCWKNKCSSCCGGKKIDVIKGSTEMVNRQVWKKSEDKKILRVSEIVSVQTVQNEIKKMWNNFVNHVNTKRIQQQDFKKDQNTINVRSVNFDFAMNFSVEGQSEVQSALWSRASIVLFTVVENFNRESKKYIICSDNTTKDKNAIFAFIETLYGTKFIDVNDVRITEMIWTDGPSSEFKNQYMVQLLKYLADKYQKIFTWKYFCTSHGKGVCDAIGGKAKMVAREKCKAVDGRLETINNASDFIRVCQANITGIDFMEVTEAQIKNLNEQKKLWQNSRPIPGISKLHAIRVHPNGKIEKSLNALEEHF